MKVVILCGGVGTRLKEETEFKPKPLVEVGGMPILWHIMKIYSHYGHKEFILCLGYKGNMIKNYFLNFEELAHDFTLNLRNKETRVTHHNNHKLEDWTIHFVDTGQATNTGGRIARVRHLLSNDKQFLLTYGDGLSDININDVIKYHNEKGKTITITAINPESPFGIIEVENGIVNSFKEKPRLSGMISGGFFVCNSKVFNYVTPDEKCVFEQEPMITMSNKNEAAAYEYDGFWYAMDTFKHAEFLNKLWAEGKAPWKIWKE